MATLTTLLSYEYKAKRAGIRVAVTQGLLGNDAQSGGADPVYTVLRVLLRSKSWSPGDLGMKMQSEGLG